MAQIILMHPLVQEIILPFLLVFVIVFAILQKTKVLGDGKKQIDSLVALAIALIVISFGNATGIIVALIPFLAVSAVTILVFMILYGMTFQGDKKFTLNKGIMGVIGALVAAGVVITLLIATGSWDYLTNYFFSSESEGSSFITNAIFIVVLIAALAFAVFGGGKSDKKD